MSVKLTPTVCLPVLVIVVMVGLSLPVVPAILAALPLVNVAEPALVITGDSVTVNMNAWWVDPAELLTLIVSG